MSKFTKNKRIRVWKKYHGSNLEAKDVFGRTMTRENFTCDHILPNSIGGSANVKNGFPLSLLSNREKADLLSGTINEKKFLVKESIQPGVGILFIDGDQVSEDCLFSFKNIFYNL